MKIKIQDPAGVVTEHDASVDDVDLDETVIVDRDGRRITEADAVERSEELLAKSRGGRPSMSKSGRSPQIGVRLPVGLDARLRERAAREHKRPSEIVREALEQYV
ncbi:MAG: ribbon-helix-helix protein, CopG family [Nocardioidaceae bacterium]|nr:ribbon-helix-helix protein, CopG family [Nocardioidaceae bacterium]MCL2613341.1 ribbon-helix-helix protein, CopG family [Nocardioidaceae bacterium]